VAQHIFGTTDTSTDAYNEAGNWVGILFAAYNLVAALFAFLLPVLARHLGRKYTHALCLTLGGIGFISIFFVTDQYMLLPAMVCVGIACASILSMPYAMLTKSLPANKMGVYMGIFNYFIVIPQILAASVLGFLVTHYFNGDAIKTLVLGGCALFIAAGSVLFVDDKVKIKN
jgi:maltose/moltooligosaccharide transporter